MASINQTSNDFRSDSSHGRVRETGVFIGIIKGNADPQRMGRLAVYIPEFGGDPEDPQTWYTVGYASPFAGATDLEKNSDSGSGMKEMSGTQKSYGFWGVPPDVNNQVLVCFVNGDTARGYWFACLYQQFMNHMVPAIGLNRSTKPEIDSQNLPPVCEYNRKDTSQNVWDPLRPVFEPLHNALSEQGLYTDPERGPATTGARRESPSKTMGLLSPRGNSIHIDDLEENEFIRLRTRGGVQVLIHETTGYIYFISKKGDSWVEISDEGIDMYTKRSINMRAEESINMHADKNINSQGSGAIHTRGGNHTQASETQSTTHVAGNTNTVAGGTSTTDAQGGHNRNGPQIRDGSNASNPSSVQSNGSGGNGQNGQGQNGQGQNGNGGNSGTGGTGGSGGSGSGGNGSYQRQVRSTYYMSGERISDPDTDAGRTSTGVRIQAKGETNGLGIATANNVGVAAVDPSKIPYGSQITVDTPDGPRYYVAADTGGAVKRMTASNGSAPVIDFFSPGQVGGTYTNVTIKPYTGPSFTGLSTSQKQGFFNINNFR